MSREVRKVPENWKHPVNVNGNFIPLFGRFDEECQQWDEGCAKWNAGEFEIWVNDDEKHLTFEQSEGSRPVQEDYMPVWSEDEATHYMMYETTSEGTPISPAFETPEELAKWLFENKVSFFGLMTASYGDWLRIAKG